MRFGLYIFCCALIISCSSPLKDKEQQTGLAISQSLSELNIEARIQTNCDLNSLTIDIEYIDKYFLLEETNKLLNSYLLISIDSLIGEFDSVVINRSYVDFVDSYSDTYLQNNIETVTNTFNENTLFLSIVRIMLTEIDNTEEIAFEEVNKELTDLHIPDFQSTGSFWLLLLDYSINCCDSTSIEFKSMSVYEAAVNYPKRKVRPEVIDRIIKMCKSSCENE